MQYLTALYLLVHDRVAGRDNERGDVPGWVMITIMTAGLVVVLWGVAETQLRTILQSALDSVTGPGG